MKVLSTAAIKTKKIAITDISVIHQVNLWSVCSHPNGRLYNGFLLFDGGECTYSWGENQVNLQRGALIYLPAGAVHSVTAPERSLHFYRINFTVTDMEDLSPLVFSDTPWVVCENVPTHIFELCEKMKKETLSQDSHFRLHSLLYSLLDFVSHAGEKPMGGQIAPAIEHIRAHYTQSISVSALAERCFLSEAQLFRLFKRKLGMSPIEYKNHLKIEKAKELLRCDEECTVGEIADLLGFENICYFSRVFKKHEGISPSEYRTRQLSSSPPKT